MVEAALTVSQRLAIWRGFLGERTLQAVEYVRSGERARRPWPAQVHVPAEVLADNCDEVLHVAGDPELFQNLSDNHRGAFAVIAAAITAFFADPKVVVVGGVRPETAALPPWLSGKHLLALLRGRPGVYVCLETPPEGRSGVVGGFIAASARWQEGRWTPAVIVVPDLLPSALYTFSVGAAETVVGRINALTEELEPIQEELREKELPMPGAAVSMVVGAFVRHTVQLLQPAHEKGVRK